MGEILEQVKDGAEVGERVPVATADGEGLERGARFERAHKEGELWRKKDDVRVEGECVEVHELVDDVLFEGVRPVHKLRERIIVPAGAFERPQVEIAAEDTDEGPEVGRG